MDVNELEAARMRRGKWLRVRRDSEDWLGQKSRVQGILVSYDPVRGAWGQIIPCGDRCGRVRERANPRPRFKKRTWGTLRFVLIGEGAKASWLSIDRSRELPGPPVHPPCLFWSEQKMSDGRFDGFCM